GVAPSHARNSSAGSIGGTMIKLTCGALALCLVVSAVTGCGDDKGGGVADAAVMADASPVADAVVVADSYVAPPMDATMNDADPCAGFAVTAIDPKFAWNGVETPVTISGSGFAATPTVTVLMTGGVPSYADQVAFVSSSSITASIPPALMGGAYGLTVTN